MQQQQHHQQQSISPQQPFRSLGFTDLTQQQPPEYNADSYYRADVEVMDINESLQVTE